MFVSSNLIRLMSRGILLFAACAAPASAFADSQQDVMDQVGQRMVKIFGAGGVKGLYAYSTGFLVSSQGHIVTVWSHVLDDQTVTVLTHDGRRFEGKVVGYEPQLDLAVLKIDGEDLPFFDLENIASASAGTRVLAFSNMFKVATGDEPVSVLHGVIAAKTKLTARRGVFETPYSGPVYIVDAITNNPGSGGGVLTTRDGKLLAMIGKELRNSQTNTWMNYAIPVGELKTVVGEIVSGKFVSKKDQPEDADVSKPRRYVSLDFGMRMIPDVLFRTPAFVDDVLPDSLAAKADIRPNDLVLFVNDELIQSCRNFRETLGRLESGDLLRLVLRRGNRLVSVELAVPKKPEPEKKSTIPNNDDPKDDGSQN